MLTLRLRKLSDFLKKPNIVIKGKPKFKTQANQKEKHVMVNSKLSHLLLVLKMHLHTEYVFCL